MAYFQKRMRKNGDVVYLVQVHCGYDPVTGKGKMVSRTSKSPSIKKARKLAAELLAQHERGELVTERKITVGTLLDGLLLDYKVNGKSLAWAEIVCNTHLRPVFGNLRPDQLNTTALQRYVAKRQELGRANGTINLELALLRRAFVLGAQSTPPLVGRVPRFPRLRVDNARQGFFEHNEYQVMLRALPEELRPVLSFGYFTGCRRGEILALQWSQVDLNEQVVRLEPGTTKNKDGRLIPLAAELTALLRLQKERRDMYWPQCPWVFFHHHSGRPIRNFRAAWIGACRKAGLWEGDEKTGHATRLFHDLRRSAVRNLVRAGTPEAVAMKVSGHRTRAVFDRYSITSERDLKEAAARLGAYLATKEPPPAQTDSSTNLQHLAPGETVQ